MLTPAEVLPFLLHENAKIQEHALHYLIGAHDPSPATADDLWALIDRSSGEMRADAIRGLGQLPATERSTARFFDAIRTGADRDLSVSLLLAKPTHSLESARLALGDPELAARLGAGMRDNLQLQLALASLPFDELWKALEKYIAEIRDDRFMDRTIDLTFLRFAKALACFPEEAAARGLAILRRSGAKGAVETWMDIFAATLFSHVGCPEAIEPLLALVGDEDIDWNDSGVNALVHLGTVDVVAAVEARFASSSQTFREFSTGILGRIKRPESELALIRLLGAEEDFSVRTLVADALCELCTTSREALDAIWKMVETGEYDGDFGLDEQALAARTMAGYPLADAAPWWARFEERRAAVARRRASMDNLITGPRAPARKAPAPARRGFVPYGKKAKKKGKK